MIWALTSIIFGLVLVIAYQNWNKVKLVQIHKDFNKRIAETVNEQYVEWQKERQQLLDRIQAPTFDHYKQAEIRVIKAQNGEKEPPKLEQL
jgi:hypothetical protein